MFLTCKIIFFLEGLIKAICLYLCAYINSDKMWHCLHHLFFFNITGIVLSFSSFCQTHFFAYSGGYYNPNASLYFSDTHLALWEVFLNHFLDRSIILFWWCNLFYIVCNVVEYGLWIQYCFPRKVRKSALHLRLWCNVSHLQIT